MEKKYIKQIPKIEDDGYYYPSVEYCEEGTESTYRKVISKEDFVKCFIMIYIYLFLFPTTILCISV